LFPDDVNHCPTWVEQLRRPGETDLDGRYQLEKRLAGRYGCVYKARHISQNSARDKIILPDLSGNDPNLVTRFRQEALAAAAIRHQEHYRRHRLGVVRGTMPFLVMEFVQGRSLAGHHGRRRRRVSAFELIQPICAGLPPLTGKKLSMRDLKPLNVMIQEGVPVSKAPKILDFGLAKINPVNYSGSFIAAQTTGLRVRLFIWRPSRVGRSARRARRYLQLGVMLFQICAARCLSEQLDSGDHEKAFDDEVPLARVERH